MIYLIDFSPPPKGPHDEAGLRPEVISCRNYCRCDKKNLLFHGREVNFDPF